MRTLRQKRMYEAQLAQLTQQTFNMESAALATENLRNTMATVDAMQQANKELRKQYGKIDVDKIEVRFPLCFPLGREADLSVTRRISIMTWRTCSSRPMRSRRRLGVRMPFRTRLMRQICRPVSNNARRYDRVPHRRDRTRCARTGR